jgi:hypothetical protein
VAESAVSSLRIPNRNAERCRSFSALWNTKHKGKKHCAANDWYLTQRHNLFSHTNFKKKARKQEKESIKLTEKFVYISVACLIIFQSINQTSQMFINQSLTLQLGINQSITHFATGY